MATPTLPLADSVSSTAESPTVSPSVNAPSVVPRKSRRGRPRKVLRGRGSGRPLVDPAPPSATSDPPVEESVAVARPSQRVARECRKMLRKKRHLL